MPLRMLALGAQQRLDLSRAWHHYKWQHAAATTGQQRSAALSTWQSALESILTQDQEIIVNAYHGYSLPATHPRVSRV